MPTTSLRRFKKVFIVNGETKLVIVEPESLKKGDMFKILTDDPSDHLFSKKNVVFQAASDWDPNGEGPGGNIQVVVPLPPEGLFPNPDILK